MKVDDIERVAIVGAGLMGHGIAQEFALAGYKVHVHDLSEERLQQALDNIRTNLEMLKGLGMVAQEEAESLLKTIHASTVLEETVAEADVVILGHTHVPLRAKIGMCGF